MVDAIVVGAGLAGLTAARRLAAGGLRVSVFERRTVAAESSALAAGHVPQRAFARSKIDVLRGTRRLVEDLERRSGGLVRFNVVGGLVLSTTRRNASVFEEHVAQLREWGLTTTEVLAPAEVARRWSAVFADDLVAALHCPDDGFVRSLDLAVALAADARAAGVAIFEGCPVERIDVADGQVRGVVVAGERISASRVVLAAGGWSLPLARASGFAIPLRLFTLSAVMIVAVPVQLPFISEVEARFYAISRGSGSMLLGLPPRLEDASATDFARDPLPSERARFFERLRHRVPALDRSRMAGGWTGLLAGTPDGYPLLGPYPGIDGLHVATGFAGGGVQWVAAAEAVAEIVLGARPFFDAADHLAARFTGYAGEDFEFRESTPYYYDDAARASSTTASSR